MKVVNNKKEEIYEFYNLIMDIIIFCLHHRMQIILKRSYRKWLKLFCLLCRQHSTNKNYTTSNMDIFYASIFIIIILIVIVLFSLNIFAWLKIILQKLTSIFSLRVNIDIFVKHGMLFEDRIHFNNENLCGNLKLIACNSLKIIIIVAT